MRVISFISEKGGSGKTSLSTNIAAALHRKGKKTVILDCDPQGSARDWRERSPEDADLPPVLGADRPDSLRSALQGVNADVVIIDGPPRADAMSAAIIRASHACLIPVQPSGLDIWAAAATVKQIQGVRDLGGEIAAAFLVNRLAPGTKLGKLISEGEWHEYEGVGQLESSIANRTAFPQAATSGLSVFDLNDQKAKDEILAVIDELEKAAWLKA